jgi:hypothetical protein
MPISSPLEKFHKNAQKSYKQIISTAMNKKSGKDAYFHHVYVNT